MQLEHSFSVPVGVDEAWKILLDIERIGPCMPGAAIDSVDGDDFTGTVKVKLGPINLTYKGKASFVEKDEVAHRAVIDARGRDSRGNGTANAVVTATLAEADGSTTVRVNTDLDITGKPAQFGRGVMVDVGNKLIGQFATALAGTIRAGEPAGEVPGTDTDPLRKRPRPPKTADLDVDPAPTGAGGAEPLAAAHAEGEAASGSASESSGASGAVSSVTSVNGHPPRAQQEVEPIDLIASAGPAVAKRLAPVAVALVVLFAAWRRHAGKRA